RWAAIEPELATNSEIAPVVYDRAACVPTPISRPIPRKCHLKFAGCFTMQIRCNTMRPTGYLAIVVIKFGSANDTRQQGRSFEEIGRRRKARKRIGSGEGVPLREEVGCPGRIKLFVAGEGAVFAAGVEPRQKTDL